MTASASHPFGQRTRISLCQFFIQIQVYLVTSLSCLEAISIQNQNPEKMSKSTAILARMKRYFSSTSIHHLPRLMVGGNIRKGFWLVFYMLSKFLFFYSVYHLVNDYNRMPTRMSISRGMVSVRSICCFKCGNSLCKCMKTITHSFLVKYLGLYWLNLWLLSLQ